jgi:hypothetical protein
MGLDIARIGEPRSLPNSGDTTGRKTYQVATKPLPPGLPGDTWFMIFSEQLTGPLLAEHDRAETITVTCDPRDYPNWLWLVDIAILRTNEKAESVALNSNGPRNRSQLPPVP